MPEGSAIAVEVVRALGGALIALLGLLAVLWKRGRNGHGPEHCHHCQDVPALEQRVNELARWREDTIVPLNNMGNRLRNVLGHAKRLEREADEFRSQVAQQLRDMNDKLDQLLGWTKART